MTTAAALIIGNEILTGKVQDANTWILARILFEQGVELKRVETVLDEVDEIASCVSRLSSQYDYVFTSGGIGPTHDDKTYEGVAKAFSRPLAYHEASLKKLQNYMQEVAPDKPLNDARKRMAFLPKPCDIIESPDLWVPLVVVENVYVLPGIPKLFEYMLTHAKDRFQGVKSAREMIFTMKSEGDIADDLSRLQELYPDVEIGSYPKYDATDHKVMVSVEGKNAATVSKVAQEILDSIDGFRSAQ